MRGRQKNMSTTKMFNHEKNENNAQQRGALKALSHAEKRTTKISGPKI